MLEHVLYVFDPLLELLLVLLIELSLDDLHDHHLLEMRITLIYLRQVLEGALCEILFVAHRHEGHEVQVLSRVHS